MNRACHELMTAVLGINEKPKARRLPIICCTPFIMYLILVSMKSSAKALEVVIPVNNSTSLFFSLVPHARQEDEGGLRDGLKQAEESSKGNQTSEILHCGVKSKRDPP
jgi:hypothetical protein